MRYINKGEEPLFMKQWKEEQKRANLPLRYSDFRDKSKLNEVLRTVQHGICCYCEKSIDHFQGNLESGAHNEHLIPESGPNGVLDKQMDFENIYACCIASKGKERKKTHCGEHKADQTIFPFIQDNECHNYFKYNVLGEITPNGKYVKWSEYEDNIATLTSIEKEATRTIKVLNLNCCTLVNERKENLLKMMQWAVTQNAESIRKKIEEFENREVYPQFVDLHLFFLRKRLR